MSSAPQLAVEAVAHLADRLARALCDESSASGPADSVEEQGSLHERLLAMRSALVSTRPRWESLSDADLVAEARRVLAESKGLAVDLPA